MVNVWESVDAVSEARRFSDLYGVQGAVLVDERGGYAAAVGLRGVPCNVLVGADGVVQDVGASTPAELHAAVSALIGRRDW